MLAALWHKGQVSIPSRATTALRPSHSDTPWRRYYVSIPSRATTALRREYEDAGFGIPGVSIPSRATTALRRIAGGGSQGKIGFQSLPGQLLL